MVLATEKKYGKSENINMYTRNKTEKTEHKYETESIKWSELIFLVDKYRFFGYIFHLRVSERLASENRQGKMPV